MRPDFLDRYSRLSSPVHRLPAAVKTTATLALITTVAAAPRGWTPLFVATAAALLVLAAMSRIPPLFLVRRLLLLEPFVIGVAFLSLFQPGGWERFVVLLARSTLCLFALILFTNTTPFSQLLTVLRRVRVPGIFVTLLALMYRYIFVLLDESTRLQRARASRSFSRRAGRGWRGTAQMAGQLFVRSSERAERIYDAMCARGWRP